jgi:hypothetical protein
MKPAFEASDGACADALGILFHDVAANRKRLRIYIHVWDTRCCVRNSASGCRSENGTADPLCSTAAPRTQAHVHDRYRLMSPSVPELAADCDSWGNPVLPAFRCARYIRSTCCSGPASCAARWVRTSIAMVRRGVLSQYIRCWHRVKDGNRSNKCCKVLLTSTMPMSNLSDLDE